MSLIYFDKKYTLMYSPKMFPSCSSVFQSLQGCVSKLLQFEVPHNNTQEQSPYRTENTGFSYKDEAANAVCCENHAKCIVILCGKVWRFSCEDSVIYVFSFSVIDEVSHACS